MPNRLFVMQEISFDADALLRALLRLAPPRRLAVLDSCHAQNDERFLIAAFDAIETIEVFDTETRVRLRAGEREEIYVSPIDDALEHVTARLEAFGALLGASRAAGASSITRDAPALSLAGGACIVTLAYEFAHTFLDLRLREPSSARNKVHEPLATFSFYDALIVHDYQTARTFISSIAGDAKLQSIADALKRHTVKEQMQDDKDVAIAVKPDAKSAANLTSNFTPDAYRQAVERIKTHIFAGDIYQANLTQQLTCTFAAELAPETIFQILRRTHPATHAAFLRRTHDTVISISPERFLRVKINDALVRIINAAPIKGTRPRGKDAGEDENLRRELYESAKDRAENVMIVDLMRNDLGRVCEFGSIEVTNLYRIEEHPTLFHLVSDVRGRLRNDVTFADLIRACFPCGSITGAPKLRAMEILHDIEPDARYLSMGAIGYLAFDGTLDLSVAIRTMTIKENVARFNVGGGITADSDAHDEYDESMLKARALLHALNAGVSSVN